MNSVSLVSKMERIDFSIYKEKNLKKNIIFLREHIYDLDVLEARHFFKDDLIYPENFLREIWGHIWMYSNLQKQHHFSIDFLRETHECISWTNIINSPQYTKKEKEKFIKEFKLYQNKDSNYWFEEQKRKDTPKLFVQ